MSHDYYCYVEILKVQIKVYQPNRNFILCYGATHNRIIIIIIMSSYHCGITF